MKIFQSKSFANKIKKLSKTEKTILDKEIKKLVDESTIGVEKKGDLRGIYVHKFKMKTTQYLLSYRYTSNDLELIMLGPHENYYRDLKTYIKKR